MKKIYYEKRGRRYVPVREYDNDWMDAFPEGNHLIMCYPGAVSRRYKIDPALAPMIAAGRHAEDAITRRIHEATELRPAHKTMDEATARRWNEVVSAIPDDFRYVFSYGSAHDAAQAGVEAMQAEADKLMQNEAVRNSYEHFMLMCKLAKEHEHHGS